MLECTHELNEVAREWRLELGEEQIQEHFREDLGTCNSLIDDLVGPVVLREPLSTEERVLAECVKALVDLRKRRWIVEVKQDLVK